MKSKLICTLAIFSILSACGQTPEEKKVKPHLDPDAFSQSYEESLRPANAMDATAFAEWKKIDNKMQALVPSKAALFTNVLYQTEVYSVATDAKREAGLKLNAAGRAFLTDLQIKCWVFDATQSKSRIDNNTEQIRGALGLTGDSCLLAISETQDTKRVVVARSADSESFTTVTQQSAKFEVKDASIAANSGFTSLSNSLKVSGSYLQYPKTSYKYASAKVSINGTFSIKLTSGDVISGNLTGESNLGPRPAAQYLLEGTSNQGAIRLIIKRSAGKTQYFFNGTEVMAANVPSFLNMVDDYFQ